MKVKLLVLSQLVGSAGMQEMLCAAPRRERAGVFERCIPSLRQLSVKPERCLPGSYAFRT